MIKADIVSKVATTTGAEKKQVAKIVDAFIDSVKDSLSSGEDVYLRGFGTFLVKHRAETLARHISKNTTIVIPAHNVPVWKPSKGFVATIKESK